MSNKKQIEGYLITKLKPKNKIECIAWLLLNVFGCKFCKACRDKPCNVKDGETCTNNIANYIREAVKEEAGYRKQSEGEWIDFYKGKYANPLYVCSVCEKGTLLRVEGNELGQPETVQALSSFCPNCGAKMKGGE